jgi:hypothetical protein
MKTRKIRIKALSSDEIKIREKYEVKKITGTPITFEIEVSDTSEVLKQLSTDKDILDWSDASWGVSDLRESNDEIKLKKVSEVDLMKDSAMKGLYSVDLTDMRTVINMCLFLKESHEYNRENSSSTPNTIITDVIKRIGEWHQNLPRLSEELVKNILRDMSAGKKEFGNNLYYSLVKTLKTEFAPLSDEAYLKLIFVDNYENKALGYGKK